MSDYLKWKELDEVNDDKPSTPSQVRDECKRETNNWTNKKGVFRYAFEEEAKLAQKYLSKHGYNVEYNIEPNDLFKDKESYNVWFSKEQIPDGFETGEWLNEERKKKKKHSLAILPNPQGSIDFFNHVMGADKNKECENCGGEGEATIGESNELFGLYLKVVDENNRTVEKWHRIDSGSKEEMKEKKKQLEETSPEDSHHNRNKYRVELIPNKYDEKLEEAVLLKPKLLITVDSSEEYEDLIGELQKNDIDWEQLFEPEDDPPYPVEIYGDEPTSDFLNKMKNIIKELGFKTESLDTDEMLQYSFRVYKLDDDGDELENVYSATSFDEAKEWAQKQDYPTHIVYVPNFDPDDDPDTVNQGEYDDFEVVWSSLNENYMGTLPKEKRYKYKGYTIIDAGYSSAPYSIEDYPYANEFKTLDDAKKFIRNNLIESLDENKSELPTSLYIDLATYYMDDYADSVELDDWIRRWLKDEYEVEPISYDYEVEEDIYESSAHVTDIKWPTNPKNKNESLKDESLNEEKVKNTKVIVKYVGNPSWQEEFFVEDNGEAFNSILDNCKKIGTERFKDDVVEPAKAEDYIITLVMKSNGGSINNYGVEYEIFKDIPHKHFKRSGSIEESLDENNKVEEDITNEDIEKEIQVRDNPDIEKDAEDCPLPLEMIPNEMGINLSNVEKVKWDEQEDGQLKKVEIDFNPADELEEDIEKHDTLNPALFENDELKPDVEEAIRNIANEFVKELQEDEINFNLKDIILLGSNVSYNYTKDSDLDIHLIADSDALNCPKELVDKLYSAYRSIFNKNYEITIKGIPAEIYVELDEPRAMSNGIYSLNSGWIKHPEQTAIPDLDEEKFNAEFEKWEDRYFELIGVQNDESVIEEKLSKDDMPSEEEIDKCKKFIWDWLTAKDTRNTYANFNLNGYTLRGELILNAVEDGCIEDENEKGFAALVMAALELAQEHKEVTVWRLAQGWDGDPDFFILYSKYPLEKAFELLRKHEAENNDNDDYNYFDDFAGVLIDPDDYLK